MNFSAITIKTLNIYEANLETILFRSIPKGTELVLEDICCLKGKYWARVQIMESKWYEIIGRDGFIDLALDDLEILGFSYC